MKVKIVSDGTTAGTRVTNEAGEIIENIGFLQIFISADQMSNEIILGLDNIPCEIICEAKVKDV